jgi:CheY-like chemotaxis protein
VILVVDDEVHVRRVLSLVLADEGYDVLTASDGPQALQVFRERADEVALVVLDLLMPRMGGEEVLAELHRERPELPVVLVSGYAEDLATRNLGSANLAGFIKKPFHLEALVELVDSVVLRPPSHVDRARLYGSAASSRSRSSSTRERLTPKSE